jgi:hypothetical protein
MLSSCHLRSSLVMGSQEHKLQTSHVEKVSQEAGLPVSGVLAASDTSSSLAPRSYTCTCFWVCPIVLLVAVGVSAVRQHCICVLTWVFLQCSSSRFK